MAKKQKGKKIDRMNRLGLLMLNITGTVVSKKGLEKLNTMAFMQPGTDAKPEDKNYKPLIASSVLTLGSGAGAVFIPNSFASQFFMGIASGSVLNTWDNVSSIKGIGNAPAADVKKFMDLYKDLNNDDVKGTTNELKFN